MAKPLSHGTQTPEWIYPPTDLSGPQTVSDVD